jgi:hypothetical protein
VQKMNIIGRPAHRMWCSSCETEGDVLGFCDCAEPSYVPAGERAAAAVAAHPEKSDRAIAAEIGVNKSTVTRARATTDANAPVESEPVEDKPKKRVGLDGKARKAPAANTKRQAAALAQSDKAAALRDAGWSTAEIAAELGHSKRYTEVILEKVDIARAGATGDSAALGLTENQKLALAIKRAITRVATTGQLLARGRQNRRSRCRSPPGGLSGACGMACPPAGDTQARTV